MKKLEDTSPRIPDSSFFHHSFINLHQAIGSPSLFLSLTSFSPFFKIFSFSTFTLYLNLNTYLFHSFNSLFNSNSASIYPPLQSSPFPPSELGFLWPSVFEAFFCLFPSWMCLMISKPAILTFLILLFVIIM